jgi:histone H1/5
MKSSVTSMTGTSASVSTSATSATSGSTSATESTVASVALAKRSGKKATGPKVKNARAGKKAMSDRPSYLTMVLEAISDLKDRRGSSKVAVQRFMTDKYRLDKSTTVNSRVRTAIRSAMTRGLLTQAKGIGASGSFKLTPEGKALAKGGSKIAPKSRGRPAATAGRKDAKKAPSTTRKPRASKGKSVKNRPPTPLVPVGKATPSKRGAKSPAKRPRVAKPKKTPTKTTKRSATPKRALGSKSATAKKGSTPGKAGRPKSATSKRAGKSHSLTPRRAVGSRSSTPRRASDSASAVGKKLKR